MYISKKSRNNRRHFKLRNYEKLLLLYYADIDILNHLPSMDEIPPGCNTWRSSPIYIHSHSCAGGGSAVNLSGLSQQTNSERGPRIK